MSATATLTFQLPEQAVDHRFAVNGASYHAVLYKLEVLLRDRIAEPGTHPVRREECELLRDWLYGLMADEDVRLEDGPLFKR